MTLGRVSSHLIGLLLFSGLATGCAAYAQPLMPTGTPALNVPEPPVRVVVPAPEQPTLPPVEEAPPSTAPASPTSKAPVRNPNPRPVVTPPPAEPPPATVPPPPAILLTSANTAEFEKRVRAQLALAQANLAQVNRANLGTDAKAQYDAAQGFIRQADEALKVKNLVYAGQLADKAATMAALLRRYFPTSLLPHFPTFL